MGHSQLKQGHARCSLTHSACHYRQCQWRVYAAAAAVVIAVSECSHLDAVDACDVRSGYQQE